MSNNKSQKRLGLAPILVGMIFLATAVGVAPASSVRDHQPQSVGH